MRRLALLVVSLLILAGCGGSSQRVYHTSVGVRAHSPTFGLPPKGAPLPHLFTVTPTVEMRDSVTVSAIPAGTRAVAGYTAGAWPTYLGLVRAFPRAYHVSIAIQVFYHAKCLDVEPGDAVPSQVPGWVRIEISLHVKPCVYSNASTWGQIRYFLARAGIPRSAYLAWLAYWTFRPGLVAGYDAVQWTSHGPHGENYDESTVTLAFLGATPTPRLVCFGPHAQLHNRTCERVRPLVSRQSRARAATGRALHRNACRKPYRRGICVRLDQRWRYFDSHARATARKYS
jgi:hypothetical protein